MNIVDLFFYVSPGIPQAEAELKGANTGEVRIISRNWLAAVQSRAFIGGALNSLFTCIFWNLLYFNIGPCIYMISCILLGVTVSVLLKLAGLS